MKTLISCVFVVAGLLFCGCEKKTPRVQDSSSSSGNPVTAPVDYLGATAKAKKHADKTLDVVGINQAVKMFQAQEGRNPKSLNELVGEYLPQLPTPPAGKKFDYNPSTGEVKLVAQ